MSADRIAAIRARLAAATSGKWLLDYPNAGYFTHLPGHIWSENKDLIANDVSPVDADLIANAPCDLAWLLDELEAANHRADMAAVREAVKSANYLMDVVEEKALVGAVIEAARQWDHEWSVAPFCNDSEGEWVSLRSANWKELNHGGRQAVAEALAALDAHRAAGKEVPSK